MSYLKTVIIAIIGGIIMTIIHAPLPWTLGPIAAVSIAGMIQKHPLHWSLKIRNIALILLGYAMGRPFTAETLQAIFSPASFDAGSYGNYRKRGNIHRLADVSKNRDKFYQLLTWLCAWRSLTDGHTGS